MLLEILSKPSVYSRYGEHTVSAQLIITILFCAIITPAPAVAENLTQSDLTAGFVLNGFYYREQDDAGDELNREIALLPGIATEIATRRGRHNIALELTALQGSADYQGKNSVGAAESTTTIETIIHSRLRYSRSLIRGRLSVFYAGLSLEDQLWRRDIQSTATASGLLEWYHWPGASIELGANWKASDWRMNTVAGYGHALFPRIYVDFKNSLTSVDFPLGQSWRGFAELSIRHNAMPGISCALHYAYQQVEKSETVTIPNTPLSVYEPASQSHTAGLAIRYQFTF